MSDSEELPMEVNANKLRDIDLCVFTEIANIHHAGIEVTLFVKGTVFSGEVISGGEFYKLSSEKYASFKEDTVGSLVKHHFDDRIQVYEELYDETNVENSALEISYLHLKEVSMQVGGVRLKIGGGLLRLKIEEIDGYLLGKITNV